MTVNYVLPGKLTSTQQPALPFGTDEYSRRYQDQLNNILRLYFSQIDNFASNLLSNDGGRFLSFPHIGAHDSTSQYAAANNKEMVVAWSFVDSNSGFTLNDGTGADPANSATPSYSGVYKIDYSLQFVNTSTSSEHDVYVWVRVNGVNVIESASKFTVPKKHAGGNGALVAYSSVTFIAEAGDYVQLYWSTPNAYIAPSTDGVYMFAEPAQTLGTPPNTSEIPSVPSAIGTIAFISAISA